MSQLLSLDQITPDSRLQSRVAIVHDAVADYADQYRAGAPMPPVTIFFDGSVHWLADGYHRFKAARDAGLTEIDADVCEGGFRDALLFSVGANAAHGLRRTNADKRRAVETILADSEWNGWSNREIGRQCKVSDVYVGKVRLAVTANICSDDSESVTPNIWSDNPNPIRTYRNKHGGYSNMNFSNISKNRRKAEAQPAVAPQAATPTMSDPSPVAANTSGTITFKENDPWYDWSNRDVGPDDPCAVPVERLRNMPPEQAAQAIVGDMFAECGDPRIPFIDVV